MRGEAAGAVVSIGCVCYGVFVDAAAMIQGLSQSLQGLWIVGSKGRVQQSCSSPQLQPKPCSNSQQYQGH